MRAVVFGTLSILSLVACGDDGGTSNVDAPTGGDIGFNKPKAALHANKEASEGVWTDLGIADFSCLNTPSTDVPVPTAFTATVLVTDFQGGKEVHDANVTAFDGIAVTSPFNAAVTSGVDGKALVAIPAGKTRIGFKMAGGAQGSDTQLDTLLLNQVVSADNATDTKPFGMASVSNSTASLLPALIGSNRTPGSGVVAGALRDCKDQEVSNFVATISSTPTTATSISGSAAYYFSASSTPLPQKHNVIDQGSANGLFVILQIPATPTAYVQMWGYKSDADLAADTFTLISELQVPVIADTVVTGSFEAKRQ